MEQVGSFLWRVAGIAVFLNASSAQADPPRIKFDPSLPENIRETISSDLNAVSQLRFADTGDSAARRNFFQNLFGTPVLTSGSQIIRYIREHIPKIYQDNSGHCRAFGRFCVDNGKAYVGPRFSSRLNQDDSFVLAVAMYAHEARHLDHGLHEHVLCPKSLGSDLAGTPNCDTEAFGAYGMSYVLLGMVAKYCTSCTLEERKAAAWAAENNSLNRILPRAARAQLESVMSLKEIKATVFTIPNPMPPSITTRNVVTRLPAVPYVQSFTSAPTSASTSAPSQRGVVHWITQVRAPDPEVRIYSSDGSTEKVIPLNAGTRIIISSTPQSKLAQ